MTSSSDAANICFLGVDLGSSSSGGGGGLIFYGRTTGAMGFDRDSFGAPTSLKRSLRAKTKCL